MKPTKTIKVKLRSKTPRERKHPDGAANQLAARNAAPKEGDVVAHFVPLTGADLKETIKEVSAKLKPAKSAPAKSNKADKAVTKARRVFRKAGCVTAPTEEQVKLYLVELAKLGKKSSRPLALKIWLTGDDGKKLTGDAAGPSGQST